LASRNIFSHHLFAPLEQNDLLMMKSMAFDFLKTFQILQKLPELGWIIIAMHFSRLA